MSFLSCLTGYQQSWRMGEAKRMTAAEIRLLQTVQGQSAPFQTTWGRKIPFNFLSIHFVFGRPHTVESFEMTLWDSKDYFLAIMIYGAASELSLKKWGEAKWLWQGGERPSNPDTRFKTNRDPTIATGCCKGWNYKWVKKGIRQSWRLGTLAAIKLKDLAPASGL